MKKRLISLFVALTMLLCLIPAAFAATFNAGTYTASANGMNGAVTVEVTFSDSAITDVKVTEHDLPRLGGNDAQAFASAAAGNACKTGGSP